MREFPAELASRYFTVVCRRLSSVDIFVGHPPLLANARLARSALKQVSFATVCQVPPEVKHSLMGTWLRHRVS
jgi:hypothetical protein